MSKKLLLADDSITIQKVVGIIFANEDYELTVVDNGDAALEKAKQIVPDIILVDALMPGKNGYEVCAGVRRDPMLSAIPLLLMTGAFEPFDEDKARQSGADDFISKPFESQQLIDRVKKLIELGTSRATTPAAAPVIEEVSPFSEPATAVSTINAAPLSPELAQAFAVDTVVAETPDEVFALGDEAIEGSADDDLWGAFELEDSADGAADFGVIADAVPAAAPAGLAVPEEGEDMFSFSDVNDDLSDSQERATATAEPQFETGWEPVEEQTFAFQEDQLSGDVEPVELGFAEEPAELESPEVASSTLEEAFSFDDGISEEDELMAPAPPLPAQTHVAFVPPPEAHMTAGPDADTTTGSISQEQLVAALSSLSREVIEKIVWEVVPDLAEVLIKEEIRKLKSGSGN